MTKEQFLKLQIGMYITDSKKPVSELVCSDFFVIKGFDGPKVLYYPLWNDGKEDNRFAVCAEDFRLIDLTQAMHASTFRETIAIG